MEWHLPELPIATPKNVYGKAEVRYGMGQDAMSNAFGGIIDVVKNQPRHDPCENIVVLQTEKDGDSNA